MSKPVALLQEYLIKNNYDAFLVPTNDEYLSEYVAPYAERLKWVSRFSGSSGISVIQKEKAAIFTDGRYTLQISEEVDSSLFSIHSNKDFYEWISQNIIDKSKLLIDPWLFSKKTFSRIENLIKVSGAKICLCKKNPIDIIWEDQPKKPSSKSFLHDIIFSGKNYYDKIKDIQKELIKQECDYFIVSSLDSIAWILNLRGSDIEHTPLNFAYLVIKAHGNASLYSNLIKFDNSIISNFIPYVNIISQDELEKDISQIPKSCIVGLDEEKTPYWFVSKLNHNDIKIKLINDPCYYSKSIKNETELNGAINSNIRDGVSVTKFLFWLKKEVDIYNTDEINAADKLFELRKRNKNFFSLSFKTISAIGAHSALPHYRVTNQNKYNFSENEIYLFDSGAQYFDGTTDITRTVILGKPNEEHKDRYTRVLKGHIALAKLEFTEKTRGSEIDYVARQSLKEINCDYDHGTGHGIGSFLCVHEGPQRISKPSNNKDAHLKPGMILSNEPGYYKAGEYGIRIENLIIVKKMREKLYFETISIAPLDRDLIDENLINDIEKKWINDYHKKVYLTLSNYLNLNEKKWLKEITQPII